MRLLQFSLFTAIMFAFYTNATAQWTWDDPGNRVYTSSFDDYIGIGFANPQNPLHIYSPVFNGMMLERNGSGGIALTFGTQQKDWNIGLNTGGNFGINRIDGTFGNAFFINRQNDFVGIGTTNPAYKLSVAGDGYINGLLILATNSITQGTPGAIRWNGGDFEGYNGSQWVSLTSGGTSGGSIWSQIGTNAYYTAGKVGIGLQSPSFQLDVNSIDFDAFRLRRDDPGGLAMLLELQDGTTKKIGLNYQGHYGIWDGNNTFGTDFFIENGTGRVGIGTTTPTHKFTVGGDVAISGSIYGASDQRLKENITPLQNADVIISQLNPTSFNFKKDMQQDFALPEGKQYGLIAQEVQKILPELVTTNMLKAEDGTQYLGINYEQLIPLLIQAHKLQQDKISALEQSNNLLLDKVAKIEALMTK